MAHVSAPPRLSRRALLTHPAQLAAALWLPPTDPPAAPHALPPLGVIALNRLAYGPRPGAFDINTFNSQPGATDADKLASFVDWQLNPAAVPDTECDNRLAAAGFVTTGKSLTQLWADYHETPGADRTLPVEEVRAAQWLRAVYSQRQLYEVLVAFWHNHFSIYAWDYAYASPTWMSYDRDVIRPRALGNFRQILEAVATSPAMLYYLDNYINQDGGPNENYARELFELHTLGAENYLGVGLQANVPDYPGWPGWPLGYVDEDIYEATRCLTGWRVNDGQWPLNTDTGEFLYYGDWHDRFTKNVLKLLIPSSQSNNAMKDGRDVLDRLAAHPGTGKFIARKLCRRLISDAPPDSIVNSAAALFTAQWQAPDQLKQVVRHIALSTEFQSTFGEKFKRPFEVAASGLRAVNANFSPSDEFHWTYDSMGMPVFGRRPPDGYADVKEAWTSTTSLLYRWRLINYAIENWLTGVTIDVNAQMSGPTTATAIVDYWLNRILGRSMDVAARRSELIDFMRGPYSATATLTPTHISGYLPRMAALILMSPDFQLY